MDKLKMHSPDLIEANIAKLADQVAKLFPHCVTEARDAKGELARRIDFDLLRQELSPALVDGPQERYQLNWPGKREALLTANAPIAKTLRPCREESVDFDTTRNLFIEGDNLEALKLLQETYLNQVKLIYIDPPYNTGRDFIYDDDFSDDIDSYKIRSNQKDEAGNRMLVNLESNGRFHSDWLSMLYSRLKLARNLLSEDGVVFISIDDNELPNLRKICDEIFGERQFVSQVIVQSNKRGQTYKEVSKTHEYLLIYSRSDTVSLNEIEKIDKSLPFKDSQGSFDLWELRNRNPKFGRFNRPNLFFPIFVDPDSLDECGYARVSLEESEHYRVQVVPLNSEGVEGCWRWGKEKIAANDLTCASPVLVGRKRKDGQWNIYEKSRKSTTKVKSIWDDTSVISEQGTIELGKIGLRDIFDHPKPLELVRRCIHLATTGDDIVMDFFGGSSTTAHAVISLNAQDGGQRRFILIQLPEITDDNSEARRGGFATISDIGKERIRRAGNAIKSESFITAPDLDIGFRVLKIDSSNMNEVYYTPDAVTQETLPGLVDNIRADRSAEDLLFQVLLDWGVDLALPIERQTLAGKSVFFVDGNALAACFDTGIDEDFVKQLAAHKPLRVVFRDAGFASDSVKINVAQVFKLLSPATEIKTL